MEAKPFNPAPVIFVVAMLPVIFAVPLLMRRGNSHGVLPSPIAAEPTTLATANVDCHVLPGQPSTELARQPAFSKAAERIEGKLANLLRSATEARQTPPASVILVNGLFFAALHSTIWPSPIPLFVVGTGLAWVRYRTSSLLGALTLHALFNGVAALTLLLKLLWT